MHKTFRFGGLLAALLLSASVYAGDIQIEGAWLRATAPGQEEASLDFSITSKQPAVLLGVSSTVSSAVEMHSMTHEKGMMRMRQVESIEIPAGKRVNLGESGYHLMLAGLKAPLKAGENIPLTLTIKESNNRTVKIETRAEVKPLTTTKASTHKDNHKHRH
ncbi:MAG: copper chaperone PCu(A)C [Gallionella sp.]|nr:copper chaperone PCu(A)C [Gallionella sp.]